MKHKYLISGLLLLATMLGSCSDGQEMAEESVAGGDTPIHFSGILAREASDNSCGSSSSTYTDLHLSAKKVQDRTSTTGSGYYTDIAITNVDGTLPPVNEEAKTLTPASALHYPLNSGLRFFAYSGTTNNGNLSLKAGNESVNDVILSNGTGEDEGKGTYGNERMSREIPLTFRHVMTKIYVGVEVDKEGNDNDDNEHVNPDPETIKITLNNGLAVASGTYPITAKATPGTGSTDVTNQLGSYTLQKGVNYLVPNGTVLYDKNNPIKPIKRIEIDAYDTNETEDCKSLTIQPAIDNNAESIKLLPGQAYGIFFKIKRLKVTEITFRQIDWETVVLGNENSSYIPAKLNIDLGDYDQSANEDKITKVILHNKENSIDKQYVGNIVYEGDPKKPVGQFVNLPATGGTAPTKVDLYTNQGLLVAGVAPDASSYKDASSSTTDKDIKISLSAGGMKTVDGGDYTTSNPYAVQTPIQFSNIKKDLTASYQQSTDLDLETLTTAFTPIGNATTAFSGTYDGNGRRILHATFSGNGLFATNSGTLKNIRIASGIITATGTHAGSICGENSGTIVACINEAQIHGNAAITTHAGGICGKNSGSIIACLNTGDIFTGSSYSGGICGENTSSTSGAITACVNVGMMNRNSTNMAGICGVVTANPQTSVLKTCYWLTGTAKRYSGNHASVNDTEVAANAYTPPANTDDVADLSPQKLRNEKGTEESNTTTALLNAAIDNSSNTEYQFTYDVATNGCVWPMPVKKSTNP